jgi:hypothetical protein
MSFESTASLNADAKDRLLPKFAKKASYFAPAFGFAALSWINLFRPLAMSVLAAA